ncbi:LacI family DNA-binding transcriptional regulator [Streptococcus loxodontisalivarius]|uniref:DNA-binding LacI/PurR family transcriptional regulator n=1 Tax=Streptococcus loxodontisalivarius TaxID=1349415 RepID=A0ABS2PTC1_9STRE|nr:LacI family DNA-binding transcriptional regulator [Streptococcus loxodontisalivarius]MBM7643287.1 DNA-binding LacI/PurR family transcriptional regulator [Streptococcus loxodontisalivarius]
MAKKVTINDIAKLVGVSKATVSYYLNGNYKKMSLETKEKIQQVIESTGYRPSKIAQSLVTNDTHTIGVVIADITNPFISSVIKGVHDTCKQNGYSVNFANSDNDILIELDNINRLNQQNISGIILDSVDANNPFIKTLDNQNLVMVDRQAEQLTVDTVVSDNKASTEKFLRGMLAAGYKDFYFVTYPIQNISTRQKRYEGFQSICGNNPDRVISVLDPDGAEKVADIIKNAEQKPAFFTMNGPTLLTFMKWIQKTNYTYPEDFGLGSYEDLEWMEILNPKVSCIRQDSYQIGCVAAERLIRKLQDQGTHFEPEIIEVVNDLVVRESY